MAAPHTAVIAGAHPYRWVILAGVCLLYGCFGMIVASLAPLVGPITQDLGISHSAMGTVLGAWPLVYIASAVVCGTFTDRIGPRRTLLLAMLVIAASAALRGLAGGHLSLFLAVAVFGLGGPLVSIGAPKLVSLWFTGKQRGLAMGVYMSGNAMGVIASLTLANSVLMPLTGGSWRAVMFLYADAALAAGLAWFVIARHPVAREMDRRIAAEPKTRQREVVRHLLRQSEVRLILALAAGMFFFNHSLNNWLPEILRSGGMAAASAGYWAAIPTGVGILASLLIPRLATPERRFIILGLLLASAGSATVLLHAGAGAVLATGLVLQGLARGAMTALAILCLMEARSVGTRYMGSASGLFFTAGEIGGVLGPLTIGALHDLSDGFDAGLYVLTALCIALLLLVGRLRRATGTAM